MDDILRELAIKARYMRGMCELVRDRTRNRQPFDLERLKLLDALQTDFYASGDLIAETAQALSPPIIIAAE